MMLLARFWCYAFRRRFMCPRGKHGDHWQYFGSRSRICRVCHREEWFYPHAEPHWQDPPAKFAESRPSWSHTDPQPYIGFDEPTNGS